MGVYCQPGVVAGADWQMEGDMGIVFWILIAVGLYRLAGALFNWNWFYRFSWSRFLERMLGRTAARIFYALLGAALVGYALSYGLF